MDDIKLGVILAQTINFGIVLFLFYYFLGDKITKIIEKRRQEIAATQNAQEEAEEKLEQAENEKQQILAAARIQAADIEKNAEELSKQNAQKTLEKTQKEAQYMIESARNQIEKEQLDMENSMKDKVMRLALKLNAKLFTKADANKDFIENEYELLRK